MLTRDPSVGGMRGPDYTADQNPYLKQAEEEVKKKRRKINPLQLVLDLLQRGQYLTANMLDEALHSGYASGDTDKWYKDVYDVLKAGIWEGLITGKRKGNYQDILKEQAAGTKFAEKPIFGEGREDKFLGKTTGADVTGFLANILLDPLTYVSFGATTGAQTAAKTFADDTVRLTAKAFKSLGDDATKAALKGLTSVSDDVLKQLGKSFDPAVYKKLLGESAEKAHKYLLKHSDDLARIQNRVYKEAYDHALRTPAEQLQREMAERTTGVSKLMEAEKSVPAVYNKDFAKMSQQAFETTPPPWQRANELLEKIGQHDYRHGGETAMRFMGKEVGVGVREPWIGKKAWNSVKDTFRSSQLGQKLSDAFYAINNRGVIGEIRNKFGIRNPYQKLIRQDELYQIHDAEGLFTELAQRYGRMTADVPRKVQDVTKKIFEASEQFNKDLMEQGANLSWRQALSHPEVREYIARELGEDGFDSVARYGADIEELLQEMLHKERQWERLGWSVPDEILNYIPAVYRDQMEGIGQRTVGASFTKTRKLTRQEAMSEQAAKLTYMFGVTHKEAMDLVEAGAGAYVTDLNELMLTRMMTHARMQSKVNMVEKLKELGVPITNLTGGAATPKALKVSLEQFGADLKEAGLQTLDHNALKGYLFDKDVADVLQRALNVTGKDQGALRRMFVNYTKWWKGMATMTPGFHLRNHYSNQLTGFLRFGPRWFTEKRKYQLPAIVGTHYALKMSSPENWMKTDFYKWFDGLGLDEKMYNRILNQRLGDYSVRELADISLREGVITRSLMGLDPQDILQRSMMKDMSTINPLPTGILKKEGKEFAGFQLSRTAGSYVENIPRFQSFLMDYDDIVRKDPRIMGELVNDGVLTKAGEKSRPAIEYATMQAKKWFLDYGDLTDFERNVMKNVIPFYSWLRKNLANQINGIILYPGMYSLVPKLEDFVKYRDPNYDPSLVPDYMRQLGFFPISKRDRNTFALFNPNIPLQDLARIPLEWDEGEIGFPQLSWKEVKDDIIGAAHPLVKSVVEMIPEKGYDVWRKKDLDERANAPYVLRLFTKKPEALLWVDGLLRTVGVEDGLDMEKGADGKLKINAKIAKLMENNMPLLRTIEFLMMGSEEIVPGLEEAIMEATEAKSDYEKTERLFQILSWYAGVKQKEVDMDDQLEWMNWDIRNTAADIKREASKDVIRFRKKPNDNVRLR